MNEASSARAALVPRLLLAALPLLTLPVALIFLCYNLAALGLIPQNALRRHIRRSNRFAAHTIVITGISSPAGLRVARAFYQTGYNVVGVEVERSKWLSPAQWSRAVRKIYVVRSQGDNHRFVERLLSIIENERVTLWVDCLETQIGQAQAKHVVERRASCACLVPDVETAQSFRTRYDFLNFAQSLRLPTLEMHRVRSRHDIHSVLNDAKGKKYLLSTPNGSITPSERAVLPRRTPSQTYQDVSQIKISQNKPWLLEQYIDGLQKYSALAIVSHGTIRAFVAFSEELDGTQLLPPQTGLSRAMRNYMQDLATRVGPDFSSHLCIDFCVDEKATQSGVVQQTLPIGARLSAGSALVLFSGKKGSIDLTRAYLSALEPKFNGLGSFTGLPYTEEIEEVVVLVEGEKGTFSLECSVLAFFTTPIYQLLTLQIGIRQFLRSMLGLLGQLLFWRESVYEFWDPLPAFLLYFVYTRTNLRRWLQLDRN